MSKVKAEQKREVVGIFFVAAAAIFGAAYFFNLLGFFGNILKQTGFGLFGVTAYIIPVILLYMAFDYFLERQKSITKKRFVYITFLVVCVSALVHIFFVPVDEFKQFVGETNGNVKATQAIKNLFLIGNTGFEESESVIIMTGGLFGGLVAYSLNAIADKVGTVIILVTIIVSELVLVFNISFSKAINKTSQAISSTKEKLDDAVYERAKAVKESAKQKPKGEFDIIVGEEKKTTKSGLFGLPSFLKDMDKKDENKSEGEVDLEEETQENNEDKDYLDILTDPNIDLPVGIKRVDFENNTSQKEQSDQSSYAFRKIEIPKTNDQDNQTEPKRENYNKKDDNIKDSTTRPYVLPSIELLNAESLTGEKSDLFTIQSLGKKLESTLNSFGISAKVVNITNGPIITRYELSPGPGVKVSKIVSLADDIALNLAATGVRIEAPIPGKSAIGIEVPNKKITPVALKRLIDSSDFKNNKSVLSCVLGRDIPGNPVICDITKMPHLLIAGATGSGKSVCINSILMSILYKATPEELKLIMIDPKVVELSAYNGIPHLLAPVVTNPKKAANSLNWAVNEMTKRYALFAEKSARDINGYNSNAISQGYDKLPLILIIIDELSDLMATSPREVEDAIARLTAMARAAGIHLIIATQRPSVDVITGVIKANIPSRIAFAVSSQVDSRTILDGAGAEKLLGKGDMLYFPIGASKSIRTQGAFVTEKEVERVTTFIKNQNSNGYDEETKQAIISAGATKLSSSENDEDEPQEDELLVDAVTIIVEAGYASISLLQRKMNIGYPRAARLIDRMNEKGYVGGFEGSKPRKVLITPEQWNEYKANEGK